MTLTACSVDCFYVGQLISRCGTLSLHLYIQEKIVKVNSNVRQSLLATLNLTESLFRFLSVQVYNILALIVKAKFHSKQLLRFASVLSPFR